jgi:hypothetical protein
VIVSVSHLPKTGRYPKWREIFVTANNRMLCDAEIERSRKKSARGTSVNADIAGIAVISGGLSALKKIHRFNSLIGL